MPRARLFVAIALLCSPPVLAEGHDDPDNWDLMFRRDEPRGFVRYPEAVAEYLAQAGGWYTQVASTTVWQLASESQTDRDNLLNTSYSFGGGWNIGETAVISYWLRGGRPIGDPKDASLSNDIGSILDINASLENNDLYLKEFYWAQAIGDKFFYTLGVIDSSYRYDFNAMANDDADHFLSFSLVNSPSIPFPTSSYAADIKWTFNDQLNIKAGVYQTNCGEYGSDCIDVINEDDWLVPVELTYSGNPFGWGNGTYRVLAFTSRTGEKSGSGLSISLDQEIGRFTPFLRISVSDSDIVDVDRFLSFGFGYQAPLGRPWDSIGVGFARGRPSDSDKRTESLIEFYWRFRLNPFVAITPDLQIVFDPADNPAADRITVVGLRLQLDF